MSTPRCCVGKTPAAQAAKRFSLLQACRPPGPGEARKRSTLLPARLCEAARLLLLLSNLSALRYFDSHGRFLPHKVKSIQISNIMAIIAKLSQVLEGSYAHQYTTSTLSSVININMHI